MTKRLAGKVALVTGASSGIGRAAAVAFAAEGANVVCVGRRAKELEATVQLGAGAAGRLIACVADVTNESQIAVAAERTLAEFGRLDIGLNAAGGTFAGGLTHQHDAKSFRDWIDSHLVGAFLSAKHAIAAMLKSGGGSVINVGTFVGLTKSMPGTSGYAAAKSGLIGLTRTIATEYATQGIRANVLVVGGTDTPMFRLWNDDEAKRAGAARLHALGRVASPVEIANAAVFLGSEESSFVTGSTFTIDGGISLLA